MDNNVALRAVIADDRGYDAEHILVEISEEVSFLIIIPCQACGVKVIDGFCMLRIVFLRGI